MHEPGFFEYTHKYPARSSFTFYAMHTGIFNKSYKRKLWHLTFHAVCFYIYVIVQPLAKPVFLQCQIGFYKFTFLRNGYSIISPLHILPLHDCKFFNHISRLIFLFQQAVHSYALKRIKQKMRIYLAVQCKKLCIFLTYKHLLFFYLILIYSLDQVICAAYHPVVIFYHAADLIFALPVSHRYKLFAVN